MIDLPVDLSRLLTDKNICISATV